jgi:hypothetical protein
MGNFREEGFSNFSQKFPETIFKVLHIKTLFKGLRPLFDPTMGAYGGLTEGRGGLNEGGGGRYPPLRGSGVYGGY